MSGPGDVSDALLQCCRVSQKPRLNVVCRYNTYVSSRDVANMGKKKLKLLMRAVFIEMFVIYAMSCPTFGCENIV